MRTTILHTIDTTGPGGAETVFIELATRLDARRYRNVVAVNGEGWVADELRRRGLHPHILSAGRSAFDRAYLMQLLALIREYEVDLVQSHLFGANVYCSLAGLISRRAVVGTFHGAVDVPHSERWLKLKFALLNLGADRLVFVSNHLQREMQARAWLHAAKLVPIYNGIDIKRFAPRRDTSLRRTLGIEDTHFTVGTVGNVRPAKAYDVWLRAAALLLQRAPDYRFVIAGQEHGALYDELLALRAELKLEAYVHFVGFRPDTETVLNNFDAFALSSRSEGFSIATLEALGCGIPVVATRSGGPEEILTDGVDGLLVPTGDPAALAGAIERLRHEPGLRQRLIGHGLAAVRDRFSIDAMVAHYDAMYARILNPV